MTMEGGEITVRMVLDPSDLDQVLGGRPEGMAGGAGGGGGKGKTANEAAGVSPSMGVPIHIKTFAPTFMSIFKPLAALEVLKTGLGYLVRNSTVLNQYQAAMGKVFGAAIDLLLLPFMPILNLVMAGMMALMAWLMKIGALEWMQDRVKDAIEWLKALWDHLKAIWQDLKAIKEDFFNPGKWGALFKDLAGLILDPKSWGSIAVLIGAAVATASLLKGPGAIMGWAAKGAGAGAAAFLGSPAAVGVAGAAAVGYGLYKGVGIAAESFRERQAETSTGTAIKEMFWGGPSAEDLAARSALKKGYTPEQMAPYNPKVAQAMEERMGGGTNIGAQYNTFNIHGVDADRAAELTLEELQRIAYQEQGR